MLWRRTMLRTTRSLTVLAVLAGFIYNSWIFGYWLNPIVGRHDLASELEAPHQPYNWLFIGGDIVCGLLVMLATHLAVNSRQGARQVGLIVIKTCLYIFAIGTIVDAALPLRCDPTIQHCSYHDPLLVMHGLCSIGASFGLFVAMITLWWLQRRNLLMIGIVIGYVLFGIFSVLSFVHPGADSWAQHYSLILDGICLAVVPAVMRRLETRR